jgi:hypothetical protein
MIRMLVYGVLYWKNDELDILEEMNNAERYC